MQHMFGYANGMFYFCARNCLAIIENTKEIN